MNRCLRYFLIAAIAGACSLRESNPHTGWKDHWEKPAQRELLLSSSSIHPVIKRFLRDTSVVVLTHTVLSDSLRSGPSPVLGDIDGDEQIDSVLIVPVLLRTGNEVTEGAFLAFTSGEHPYVIVDQVCTGTHFFFNAGDYNGDGIAELGQYYTSCAGRVKALHLLALEKDKWVVQGSVAFDTWYPDPPMEQRIRRKGPSEFEMLEIQDYHGKVTREWVPFRMGKQEPATPVDPG